VAWRLAEKVAWPKAGFDIAARARAGAARYVEMLDKATMDEIVARVVSAIDPAP
jgi:mRNA interferase ChpB